MVCLALPGFLRATPPNIVVVMPDDMGYGDTGATGNSLIRTPNLDRLAQESAALTRFYVTPVCSTTRAGLMTGRYHHRTRCIDTFKGRSMMEPEEVTVAEALSAAGYATGIFGKWHLGDNYPMRPQDQGFDEVLVHRGGGLAQPSEPIANERRYTDPILFHNGEEVKREGYCTDIYFDAAFDFMKRSQEENKPFFVYLPPNAPHGPYHDVPEDLLAHYNSIDLGPVLLGNESEKHRDTVARVFAMVENIDRNMGRLDAFLAENGLTNDTLVIFLVDNGPNTMRYVDPFRGMKSHVHEGGIRSMFWARWPARLKAGTESDHLAGYIDILPTLLDAAGAWPGGKAPEGALPEGRKLDGISLLSQLEGKADAAGSSDRTLVIQGHRGNRPVPFHHIAVMEQEWKLVRPTGFGAEVDPDPKPFELYRIEEDPGESRNLADEHPDKVAEMKKAYEAWLADVSSTRPDNFAPPRIIIGDAAEPVTDLSIQDWRVPDNAKGWGEGGTWEVSFADGGPYEVAVRWAEPVGKREIALHVGGQIHKGTLADGATEVVFSGLEVKKGDSQVSVDAEGEIDRDSVLRFVTFRKP